MNSNSDIKPRKISFQQKIVDKTLSKNSLRFPPQTFRSSSKIVPIKLLSKSKGEWNPFVLPEKCIICWKPIEIHGLHSKPYMECRHCNRKAHQDHMLRWLSKKDFCPYCQKKW